MVSHWDEVESVAIEGAHLRGTRWKLGAAAGARRAGLSRYRLGADERAMPVHVHADQEEFFHVLAGTGLSWQDGRTYEVRAGDTIVHRAGAETHTILGAGGGLDVLAFSSGSDTGLTWLPRAQAWWNGPHWLPADGPNPFKAEDAAGPLELPAPETERAATILALDDVQALPSREGDVASVRRFVGRAAEARDSGLCHVVVAPGALNAVPHCHSAEEEIFVVLEGTGVVVLGEEEHPVRAGSVVCRPPATGVAHTFRGGDDGMTLLVYGTREPNDIAYYPRSGKVFLRGVKAMFRVQQVDYWDGER